MKKEIENIFSKKKEVKKIEIPNKKYPIVIDTREKQSLVISELVNKKANINLEKLEIGDYLIANRLIIERKTFSDFQSSILDKRLFKQMIEMRKYPEQLLIIEGFFYNYGDSNIHKNAQKGMLISIALDYNIPFIFTEDPEDTASTLVLLAKRYEKEKQTISLRPQKSLQTLEEKKKFILEGFPGIGPTISEKLLQEHKTLKKIFNLDKKDLKKIERFDEKKIEEFKKILEN